MEAVALMVRTFAALTRPRPCPRPHLQPQLAPRSRNFPDSLFVSRAHNSAAVGDGRPRNADDAIACHRVNVGTETAPGQAPAPVLGVLARCRASSTAAAPVAAVRGARRRCAHTHCDQPRRLWRGHVQSVRVRRQSGVAVGRKAPLERLGIIIRPRPCTVQKKFCVRVGRSRERESAAGHVQVGGHWPRSSWSTRAWKETARQPYRPVLVSGRSEAHQGHGAPRRTCKRVLRLMRSSRTLCRRLLTCSSTAGSACCGCGRCRRATPVEG